MKSFEAFFQLPKALVSAEFTDLEKGYIQAANQTEVDIRCL